MQRSHEIASLRRVQTSDTRSAVCRNNIIIRAGPKPLVGGPFPPVPAAANSVARREDLALFEKRIRYYLVWLEIARRLQFLCRVRRDPLVAYAVSEEGAERLQFYSPG